MLDRSCLLDQAAASLLSGFLTARVHFPPCQPVAEKQGRVFSGMITSQTAPSLTLKGAQVATDIILRTDIKGMVSSGLPLMPDGLEAASNHQAMGELIAFLQAAIPTTGKAANPNRERDFGTLPGLIESGERR